MSSVPLVRLEQQGSVLIVAPLFTFGTYTDADLAAEWARIEACLHEESVRHVTFDLGEVPYFGSTVLEWMVLIWKRIRARGGRMAVCRCSEMGEQILAAARFTTLWRIYSDKEAAVGSVSNG